MSETALLTIAVVVAGLAAALGAWFASRRFTRALRRLAEAAASDEQGGVHSAATEGPPEVTGLARALQRATADLRLHLEESDRDRRRFEQILSSMDDALVVVEADGSIGFANEAAGRTLGGRPAHLRSLAPNALRLLAEEVRARAVPAAREVETGLPTRVLQASATPLGAGRILLVIRDVTEARRVEAMRRDFVADASHELKTPAASIQAGAETVERAAREDPEAVSRFASRLRWDAARLSRIVSDLLDLSRLETERPDLEPVRLDQVVAAETERALEQAREAGVTLDLRASPVTVRGSRHDLGLLLANLLDNAVRYTPPGGRVSVEAGGHNGEATVTVADTGIGIPSRDVPRVFERFYRVDRARSRDSGGTGLGLSIARHVAERHGGRIEVESELGRGSTFRVLLPAPEG